MSLQLKWMHGFQFAGYYAAQELGYYREAGLDVTIRAASPGTDVVKEVTSGQAQFGVGTSSLLLSRKDGAPVVALAVIFQHSPYALLMGNPTPLSSIHDVAGKRVMMEPLSDEIVAYLQREGIPLAGIQRQEHTFNPEDLIEGRTDAIAAYVTNQPYYLEQAGYAYSTYTPRSAGIDFYGDNLFTSEQELRLNPERVKAFRGASLRGWEYAMTHPDAVIALILEKYSRERSESFLRFEAREMVRLIRGDLIPIGYMNPGRWQHIADTYADIGMLPKDFQLDDFLYDPEQKIDLRKLYLYLAIASIALVVIGGIALYAVRMNARLTKAQAELTATMDAVPDLLLELDGAGNVLDVKSKQSTWLEIPREDLVGRNVVDVLPSDAAATLLHSLVSCTKRGTDSGQIITVPCAHGEMHFEISVARKHNVGGRLQKFIVLSRDVTARVVAEQQIRELNADLERRVLSRTAELATARAEAESANAVKTRFLSNVSHEMRTPMQGVLGFSEIGQSHARESGQPELAGFFEKITENGLRLQTLLESLLSLAYQAWEEHTAISSADMKGIDLEELIRGCVVSMSKPATARGQFITVDTVATTTCLRGDPARLRQAIEYLIGNALRYSPPGSSVCLRLNSHETTEAGVARTTLSLQVIDQGCGIPEPELTAIFEPFYESSRTATGAGGTGLGLSLSRAIIERHGGTLTASNRPDGGAIFEIRLPALAALS